MERKREVVERVDEATLSLDYQKNMPQRKLQLACKQLIFNASPPSHEHSQGRVHECVYYMKVCNFHVIAINDVAVIDRFNATTFFNVIDRFKVVREGFIAGTDEGAAINAPLHFRPQTLVA